MYREIFKRGAFLALGCGFAVKFRIAALRRHDRITILNLHRVADEDSSGYTSLSPTLFTELLDFLGAYFSLITFREISIPSLKPKCILSFDDGYKDFFEVALPLLASRGIRVNQNIIPECIETQRPPLNVLAQEFVETAPREVVLGLKIPGFADLRGGRLSHRLSSFLKNKARSEQQRLADVLLPQFFATKDFSCTPMMNREEVKQVALAHEVGAHSYEHASMAYESDEYLKKDLRRCNQYFEEFVGQPMRIYAFPNGSYRREQIEIVAKTGVQHVLLVGEDFANERSPHSRFTFDAKTLNEARFKALGGIRPL